MNQSMTPNHDIIVNAESLIAELEQAGQTLLALPNTGPTTRLVQSGMDWVREATEHYAPQRSRLRPAIPDAAQISRMDQVLAWIPLIPPDRYVLRRVVGARCLVNPMTGRHLYTWRRLGIAVGADHKAVQRWHAQAIDLLVGILNRRPAAAPSGVDQPRIAPKPRSHDHRPHGG